MKILHITAQKPDSTGSGVYLSETVSAFCARGVQQAVIAGIAAGDVPHLPEGVRTRFVRFQTDDLPFPVCGMSDVMPYEATRYRDMDARMVGRFKAAFGEALRDMLLSFKPDLVICHHLYLLCGVLAEAMQRLRAECPVLEECLLAGLSHGTDIRQMERHGLERDFILEGVRALDLVFSLHDQQAQDIARVYGLPLERIKVLGTGFNQEVFRVLPGCEGSAAAASLLHEACDPPRDGELLAGETGSAASLARDGELLARDPRSILYVGKIWKQKGLLPLMGALSLLAEEGEFVSLRLAGGYSDVVEYEEICARARTTRQDVRFLGKANQEQLCAEYNRAKVFVLPSYSEGLPLVAVEALACGCSVVITDLPGFRPWLASFVPSAPVRYVALPRFEEGLTPNQADADCFERDLADALLAALKEPQSSCDMSGLSWDSLCGRVLAFERQARNGRALAGGAYAGNTQVLDGGAHAGNTQVLDGGAQGNGGAMPGMLAESQSLQANGQDMLVEKQSKR